MNSTLINQANLPNVSLSGITDVTGAHAHTFVYSQVVYRNGIYYGTTNTYNGYVLSGTFPNGSTTTAGDHQHNITVPLGGSGAALPVENAYLGVNQFVYLGQ